MTVMTWWIMSGRWFLLAAGLVLAACNVEPAQPESSSKMTLVASLDGTKVAFDNYKLSWENEDKIFVCDQDYGYHEEFSFAQELPGGRAVFEGDDIGVDGPYSACWPAESASYANSSGINVYFFRDQKAPAGGVDPSHMLLFGEGGSELHFRPAVGLLKFTVKRPDIKYLYVEPIKPTPVAVNSASTNGAQIDYDGNLTILYGRSEWMRFEPEEDHFAPGEPYYIAFLPGVYEEGILVNLFNDDDNQADKFSFNALSVEAGKVTNLGEIDGEFEPEDYPLWIECDDPISSGYAWSGSPYGMPLGDSFDLGSLIHIYPPSADQRVRYISMDERLKVTEDGIVSATGPVSSYVKAFSAVNPGCARIVYFDFGGVVKDGIYYRITDDGRAFVTNSSFSASHTKDSYSGTVEVPASVNYNGTEYPVTEVLGCAFYCCPDLVKVILPEGLLRIHTYAFDGCTSLEKLNIPSTLIDLPDVASNSFVEDCPRLSISSLSKYYPVDEYGNLYEDLSYKTDLVWLCEKTTGTNVIREGTTYIGSGTGPLYNSFATAIKFPLSLAGEIWVNSFRGDFPNLEEIIVDYPTYEEFEKIFKHYRKDSSHELIAGIFARLRNQSSESPSPVKLSVPAACVSEYATAVADYGFSQVVTH